MHETQPDYELFLFRLCLRREAAGTHETLKPLNNEKVHTTTSPHTHSQTDTHTHIWRDFEL